MPRKPMSGPPLCALMKDFTVAGLLRVMPVGLVEEALVATGKQSKYQRLLPAFLVVYLVIMLALRADTSITENLNILLYRLRKQFGLSRLKIAGGTAISFARRRLGSTPLAWLFERVAKPLGQPGQPGCFYQGLRVMAMDGTTAELQCTAANVAHFGLHTNQHGVAGYPLARLGVLMECGTWAPLAWNLGPYSQSELAVCEPLWAKVKPDMLLLADRGFYNFELWQELASRSGGLLWRVKTPLKLPVEERYPDGSYRSWVSAGAKGKAAKRRLPVRVIIYHPILEDGTRCEKVRLITTLLDWQRCPAMELAKLYPVRWRVETGFDELKTHLRGPQRVLRSQLPELVEQEIHGYFLLYYSIRAVMAEAALSQGCAPRDLSFTHTVIVIQNESLFFSGPASLASGPQADHSPDS